MAVSVKRAIAAILGMLALSACEFTDSGVGQREEFVRTINYIEPSTTARSTITFDQVVESGSGTVEVRITNLNTYCIWPNWNARIQIGMVDRTVGGVVSAPILAGQTAVVDVFAFRPRIDYASIDFAMVHLWLDPFGSPQCP